MPEKKKRNWKEYNESLVRRGELLFDTDFLSGWSRELEKSQRGEGRSKVSLSRLINEYARSHPRVPAPVQGAGRVPQDVLGARRRA